MITSYKTIHRDNMKKSTKNSTSTVLVSFYKAIGYILASLVAVAIVGLLFSLPVMYLWNLCLFPALTGVKQIGWLQAWGIMILFGLLFHTTRFKQR